MAVHQLETQESQEAIPTHQETRAWVNEHLGKTIKNHMLVRLGHEGMMLDKIMRQNKIVRDGVRSFQRGETTMGADVAKEEDMGVNIGNEIHYHGGTAAPPATTTPTPSPSAEPTLLQRLGIPALLLAMGIGGVTLGYWLKGPGNDTTTTTTDTTVIKPGDEVDVQLKLPPPTKP